MEQLSRTSERVATLEATNTDLARSNSSLTTLLNKPQSTISTSNADKDSGGSAAVLHGVDMAMIPSIPLEEFLNAELMMWTQADAQKLHKNRKYGKEEITRDMDGNPIDEDMIDEIETAVQIAAAALDDIELPAIACISTSWS
ncbi:unnamed protein product [Tilletia controversa]|nr:unnamed protein product [Tilletia controversa]